ncbi:MAG: WecB/TagA/CpsF family glycosyltransferase [Nitrospira sp.]|nr:WecB/TagA/CpsF family glycosyltransferase [Nitrospira sp.]
MKPKRIEILGVPVDCLTMDRAIQFAGSALSGNVAHSVVAVNPEKVMRARVDADLRGQLQRAAVLIPDGIGVVAAARMLGLGRFDRVPGSELMPKLCDLAARTGRRVFLFGASPEVNTRTATVLAERYKGLKISGAQHGYLKDDEMPGLIDRINRSKTDIVFVALGSPKQEAWIDRHLPQLNVKICQGVGGTFDVIAGHVKRAPAVFRAVHLEWFYRLATNPNRLARQSALPKFVFQVFRQRVTGKVK